MHSLHNHLFDRETPVGECERLSLLMEAICAGWITFERPALLGIVWPGPAGSQVAFALCPQ